MDEKMSAGLLDMVTESWPMFLEFNGLWEKTLLVFLEDKGKLGFCIF